jgi:hypothetical protein
MSLSKRERERERERRERVNLANGSRQIENIKTAGPFG